MRHAAGPPRPARAHASPPRARRATRLVAASILLLTFVACSGGGGTASRQSTDAGTSGASSDHPVREYPGGGPVDRIFPPDDHAYEMLASGRCADLVAATSKWGDSVDEQVGHDTVRVYTSAADICSGRWADAKAQADQITGDPSFQGTSGGASAEEVCARRAVLAWVRALLDEHGKDPSFTPEFVTSSNPVVCPAAAGGSSTSSASTTTSTAASSTSTSSSTTTTAAR